MTWRVACIDCGAPATSTRCPACARAARPERTTTRHTGNSRYRRLRAQVLQTHPACAYCGRAPATEVDHIIPVSKGGTNTIHNLAPACRSCNRRKGIRLAA